MTGKPYLTELLAGLDGVTAGPWEIREETGWDEAWCNWHDVGPFSLMGGKAKADSRYLSLCSPDRIRAIGEYVEQIERERDEAREEFATVAKANKEIAEWWQEADSRAYALEQKLKALERGVRATSDTAYIASLNKFSSTPCLGWEAKVASGKFGKDEMDAHAEANKLMGKHQGLAEALKLIRAALASAQSTSREEGR